MFNPYILLASLVLAVGLFGTGISIGVKWERRDAVVALVAAQNAAIESANRDAEVEKQRALSAAKKESDARLAYRTAKLKGELDAAKKSRPECSRDAESLGLLHDAIRSGNGETPAAGKLPDAVRPAPISGGWLGAINSKLGIRNDRDGGSVSPPAR